MRPRIIGIWLLGLVWSWGFSSWDLTLAYRPFGVEDAGVAGRGVFQTEGSWDYLKWNDGTLENIFLFVPVYGVTDKIELSAEIPYMFHQPSAGTAESGIGDINLVLKYLLLPEDDKHPALALKGVVKLDNGDVSRGLGSGEKDYSLLAVASKSWQALTIHAQLGYTWIGQSLNPNLRNISLYGVALDYRLNEAVCLALEFNGNRHPDSTEAADPRNALVGIIYKVSDNLLLDAGIRIGLSNSSPDLSATMGSSITF